MNRAGNGMVLDGRSGCRLHVCWTLPGDRRNSARRGTWTECLSSAGVLPVIRILPQKKRGGLSPSPFQGKPLKSLLAQFVEIEVEHQHIDARFAKKAQLTPRNVLLD